MARRAWSNYVFLRVFLSFLWPCFIGTTVSMVDIHPTPLNLALESDYRSVNRKPVRIFCSFPKKTAETVFRSAATYSVLVVVLILCCCDGMGRFRLMLHWLLGDSTAIACRYCIVTVTNGKGFAAIKYPYDCNLSLPKFVLDDDVVLSVWTVQILAGALAASTIAWVRS